MVQHSEVHYTVHSPVKPAPRHLHHFTVEQGPHLFLFPIDMLRYDACWPATEHDTQAIIKAAINQSAHKPRVDFGVSSSTPLVKVAIVNLVAMTDFATWTPTRERWLSFGWHVMARDHHGHPVNRVQSLALTPVKSTNIEAVGMLHETSSLLVRFRDSGLYEYPGVPEGTFTTMMAAPSKGKFLHQHIIPKYQAIRHML